MDDVFKCTSCGNWQPVSNFHKNKSFKIGHEYVCKECRKQTTNEWRQKNRDRVYWYRLKQVYNITEDDFLSMLAKQDHKCGICGTDLRSRKICVDHNHDTGETRGLLCYNCNTGLGHFQDSQELLDKAKEWLTKHVD